MFVERLKKLLETTSRKEVIQEIGCAQGTLSKWEHGKLLPGSQYILPLCGLFGCTPLTLLSELFPHQKGMTNESVKN